MAKSLGYLGPPGTHSEAAAIYLNGSLPEPCALVAFAEIYDAMQAVHDGRIDGALVPVENSLEGSVNITLDTLAHGEGFAVRRELIWPVHNQLMGKDKCQDVRRIYSHAQPLSQCRAYLKAHYPKAELVATSSTAKAAAIVADAPPEAGLAAICAQRAGELYGLKTLATEIQDNMANCTRFFQVQRADGEPPLSPAEKTLVICQIDGQRAGSLCEVLGEFARRDVNMTRIESRPARTELGAYIFFFDLETNAGPAKLAEAIEAVRQKSFWLRKLGEFPVITAHI